MVMGNPPRLYVFMGLVASGKSTLARAWAERLAVSSFNTDVVRKELAGKRPTSRQGDDFDRGIYTPEFSRLTYDGLLERAAAQLTLQRSVVLDGSYHSRAEREKVVDCAARHRAEPFFILCRCSEAETRRRLRERGEDPQAVSDATWDIYVRQKERFQFPAEIDSHALIEVDTEAPPAELLARLERIFRP